MLIDPGMKAFSCRAGPYSLRREDGVKKPGANLQVKYIGLEYLAPGKPAEKYGRRARIL